MGWSVTLTTNRDVSESEMDKIVSELPEKMRGLGSKQAWGYSLAADVTLESPRIVRCSGSYSASGDIAEEFCKAIAQRLEHLGCKVKIDGEDISVTYTDETYARLRALPGHVPDVVIPEDDQL